MTDSIVGPEADARRAALLARIAKHNGVPVESLMRPGPNESTSIPGVVVAAVATYEQKVISRLTAIAVFTGILAVLALISVILSIVASLTVTRGITLS